ncbi:MAG: hypothetical protein JW963_05960 [Anaerolineales bacterium]|nr:hypothetical protein [Anaerolineales bacterium]
MSERKMSDQARFEEFNTSPEKNFIEDYLEEKGYTLADLKHLDPAQARQLMKEACVYASNKLAEIELRADFVHRLHDAYGRE